MAISNARAIHSVPAAPDLLADWAKYEQRLLQKIAYRERELQELHEDYIELEAKLGRYRRFADSVIRGRLLQFSNAETKAEQDGRSKRPTVAKSLSASL